MKAKKDKKPHADAILIEGVFFGDIPNLRDYFSEEYVRNFIHRTYHIYARERKHLKNKGMAIRYMIGHFVSVHESIRRCSVCGKLFKDGYILQDGYFYACSDKCLNNLYIDGNGAADERDAQRMFLCEFYNIDYSLYREQLRTMSYQEAEHFLSSLPEADADNSVSYYTQFA